MGPHGAYKLILEEPSGLRYSGTACPTTPAFFLVSQETPAEFFHNDLKFFL